MALLEEQVAVRGAQQREVGNVLVAGYDAEESSLLEEGNTLNLLVLLYMSEVVRGLRVLAVL
jgi:hypothetical protein